LAERYYIQPELSDMYNVLCVFSIGDTKEKVDYLLRALREISDELYNENIEIAKPIDIPEIPEQVVSPRYAFGSSTVALPLRESVGQISAEFLMAYPPGIPVLCPGERITLEIIEYVDKMKEANLSIQGTEDPEVNYIKVVNDRQVLNVIA